MIYAKNTRIITWRPTTATGRLLSFVVMLARALAVRIPSLDIMLGRANEVTGRTQPSNPQNFPKRHNLRNGSQRKSIVRRSCRRRVQMLPLSLLSRICIRCIYTFSVFLPSFPRYRKQISSFHISRMFYAPRLRQESSVGRKSLSRIRKRTNDVRVLDRTTRIAVRGMR